MGVESSKDKTGADGVRPENFVAPETGEQDQRSDVERARDYYGDRIPSINVQSMHRVEAQHASGRAEHYRSEMKNAKTAKERYELSVQARAEEFFADHPEASNAMTVLDAFKEEQPQLFAEWQRVTHQMTSEEIEQAKKDLGGMKVS